LKGRNGVTVNTGILKNVSDEGKRQEWLAVTVYEIGESVKISVKKEDIIVTLILLLTPLCSSEHAGLVGTICIQCIFVCILLPSSLTSEKNLLFHITK